MQQETCSHMWREGVTHMVCAQIEEACVYDAAGHTALDDTQELLGRKGLLRGNTTVPPCFVSFI